MIFLTLLKKICAYVLCVSQLFYSAAFAGVVLTDVRDDEVSFSSKRAVVNLNKKRNAYHLRLESTFGKTVKILYLFGASGKELGKLENSEEGSLLTWHKKPLEVDFSDVTDPFSIRTKGHLHVLNKRSFSPANLEALSISMNSFSTSSPFIIRAQSGCFNGIESTSLLLLDMIRFKNENLLKASSLNLRSNHGSNYGTLLGGDIFLSGDWSNHHLIQSNSLRVEGKSYVGSPSSRVKVGGFDLTSSKYTEYGQVNAFFLSLKADTISYLRDETHRGPKTYGYYMWMKTHHFVGSKGAEFHLNKGANIQGAKRIKSQFFLGDNASSFNSSEDLDQLFQVETGIKKNAFIFQSDQVILDHISHIHLETGELLVKGQEVLLNGSVEGAGRLEIRSQKTEVDSLTLPVQLIIRSSSTLMKVLPFSLDLLKIRGRIATFGENIRTNIHVLDAALTKVIGLENSDITVGTAVIGKASFLGKASVTGSLSVRKDGYFHKLYAENDSTVTGGKSLSIKKATGNMTVRAKDVSILSSETSALDLSGRKLYAKDIVTGSLKLRGSDILASKVSHDTAQISGESVRIVGDIGKDKHSKTSITSSQKTLMSVANFKGDVSLVAESVLHTGTFSDESDVHVKAHFINAIGEGSPHALTLEIDSMRLLLRDILSPESSLKPDIFHLHSQESIDLSEGVFNFPSQEVMLASATGIDLRESTFTHKLFSVKAPDIKASKTTFKGTSLSLDAQRLNTEQSTVHMKEIYKRTVAEDLQASKEFVMAFTNKVDVGGKAGFVDSVEKGTHQSFDVGGEMDVSGAKLHSQSEEGLAVPQLIVLPGSLKGKSSKAGTGNWSHYREVIDTQPELICEGGPAVIMAKDGFWLEAPVMKGSTLEYGSQTGDVKITPLHLKEVRRWTTLKKEKNWCGKVSRTISTHTQQTQSLAQPNIASHGKMVTSAKKGNVTLTSPTVFVGSDWEVYAKRFGVEAATVAHHFQSHTSSKKSEMFGTTSSTHTVKEERQEVVPPVMHVGGSVFLYCEDAYLESAKLYVEKILESKRLKFGAQERRHFKEEHSTSKSFTGSHKSGYTSRLTEEVPCTIDVGGIKTEETILSIGAHIHNRDPHPTPLDIRYEQLKRQYIFDQYCESNTNYVNVGIIAVAALATTVATGGIGGTFAVKSLGMTAMNAFMCDVAFSSLCATVATSFISTGGDFGQTFENVMSMDTLKNAVISAATAGLIKKIEGLFPVISAVDQGRQAADAAVKAKTFTEHLTKGLIHSGVTSSVKIVVEGTTPEEALKQGALATIAHTVGGYASGHIGINKEAMGTIGHKAAHGLVGAVTGSILNSDDTKQGAISGAIGSLTAEVIAESYDHLSTDAGTKKTYTEEELKVTTFAAKAGAIMASALAKQDVRIAQDTATTALDNNFAPSVLARAPLVVASAIGSLVSLTCEEEPLLLEKVKKMFGSVPNISEEMIGGLVVPQGVYDWLSRSDLLLGTTSSPEVLRPSGVSGEGIRGMMVPPSVYEWLIKSDPLPGMESAPELLRIPKIFVTPIEERGVSVLTTPIETEAFPQILSTPLPERAKPQILSTPDLGETGLTVFTHQSYNPPPKTLPGFPDAVWGKRKTPVSSGGGLRKRWQDKQYIYEWDSQHGSIEKYKKSTGGHLGEFDYKTGIQTKPADQSRRIEK